MMPAESRLRIIVTGLVGLHPVGGVAWDYLQYVIGLSRLGHEVYYHEDTGSWPYDPVKESPTDDPSYANNYINNFLSNYAPELINHWHYYHLCESSNGMSKQAFDQIAKTADIFLNVSGASIIPDNLADSCVKVFLDTDPGYNQIVLSEMFGWSDKVGSWYESVMSHDRFFSYGENINQADCIIPRLGLDWEVTRMPIVPDLWQPVANAASRQAEAWSTVMTWNNFKGRVFYQGKEYFSKGKEFEMLLDLPGQIEEPVKVAIGGKGAPRDVLRAKGWQELDGVKETLLPADYQKFIYASRGEISTAKHIYVATRSGWFSCRSACYLAAGKPVVAQDTGYSKFIPSGLGLFAFSDLQEAIDGIESVAADYDKHRLGAVEIAREYFGYDHVLQKLLSDLGY